MARYINADTLIKAIPDTRVDMFENCRNCSTLLRDEVIEIIDTQPTVDVQEVVHGHWIQMEDTDRDGNAWFKCSICDAGDLHVPIQKVPYCWKCGAKMDGKDGE